MRCTRQRDSFFLSKTAFSHRNRPQVVHIYHTIQLFPFCFFFSKSMKGKLRGTYSELIYGKCECVCVYGKTKFEFQLSTNLILNDISSSPPPPPPSQCAPPPPPPPCGYSSGYASAGGCGGPPPYPMVSDSLSLLS